MIGLAWHPLRLVIPAPVLALVAAAMGGRHNRLAFAAVMIAALAFFLGMTIAVAAHVRSSERAPLLQRHER